jgi:hypothetical protein
MFDVFRAPTATAKRAAAIFAPSMILRPCDTETCDQERKRERPLIYSV